MKIYLSGPIYANDDNDTNWWREYITEKFTQPWWVPSSSISKFSVINPVRNRTVFKKLLFTPNEIVTRDLIDVRSSDLLICFCDFKGDKRPIGTFMEMYEAKQRNIPVVTITKNSAIADHPWVQFCSCRVFSDIDNAITYIKEFWG